jgi:hypothetical protein
MEYRRMGWTMTTVKKPLKTKPKTIKLPNLGLIVIYGGK